MRNMGVAPLREKAEQISSLLRHISKKMQRHVMEQVQDLNLTAPQIMVLRHVGREPGLNLSALSEKLGLAPSTVCGIVDRLERAGYLTRTSDPQDRRRLRLHLTPKTVALRDRVPALQANFLAGFLAGLPEAKVDGILEALLTLATLIDGKPAREEERE